MKEDKKRTLFDALNALFQKLSPQNSSYYSSTLHLQQAIWVPPTPPGSLIDAYIKKDLLIKRYFTAYMG